VDRRSVRAALCAKHERGLAREGPERHLTIDSLRNMTCKSRLVIPVPAKPKRRNTC
jgi:hypothetical protein